jgi:hypothetical protein
MVNDINFKEEVIISIHEKQTNQKLQFLSVALLFAGLVTVVLMVFLNLFFTRNLEEVKAVNDNLISQIQDPQNKKKEALYFLVKDRLNKINSIDKSRVRLGDFLIRLSEIDKDSKIDSINLTGNTCVLTFKIDDYSKFVAFNDNLNKYKIDEGSMVVQSTSLSNGTYKIIVNFVFKT